jgi:hypothetical protein
MCILRIVICSRDTKRVHWRVQRGYIGGYKEGTLVGTLGYKSVTTAGTNPVQGTKTVHWRVQKRYIGGYNRSTHGSAETSIQGAKEVI